MRATSARDLATSRSPWPGRIVRVAVVAGGVSAAALIVGGVAHATASDPSGSAVTDVACVVDLGDDLATLAIDVGPDTGCLTDLVPGSTDTSSKPNAL